MARHILRPEIESFKSYTPGRSIEEIREEYGLRRIIKLASNENPLGASPVVRKALERAALGAFRYPQNGNPRLIAALAEHAGVPEEMILAGNGSDEIIDLIMRVRCRPGVDHVYCYEHSFSMYGLCAKLNGVEYREVPRGEDFRLPLEYMAEVADEHTALVFVTSPDNPTGLAAHVDELTVLAGMLPKETLLVVDQAYVEFSWPPESYDMLPLLERCDNVVVLRTFSKVNGLAGLRVGWGAMPVWLAAAVRKARPPFTVNVLAEAAALAALDDDDFTMATLDVVFRGRELFFKKLAEMGCEVTPSQANFVMFKPPVPAAEVNEKLLRAGFIVRPLASFGLPDRIRVNIGTDEENGLFLDALREILHG